MNQILDHSGPKKKSIPKSLGDIRKIIRVFSIIILIFGIVLIVDGSYALYRNNKNDKEEVITKPVITVTNNDDLLTIEVNHDKAIEEVTYQWDDGDPKVIKGKGENSIVIDKVGVLAEEHTLKVIARDINNVEAVFENSYYSEKGIDTVEPKIDIITGNPIKIVATDETALSYITYRIGDEEEKTIYATEGDDSKKIECELEIDSDESEITVCAVDTSNNTAVKSNVKVLKTPKIEMVAETDYSKIYVTITSELGLKKVQYELNGEVFASEFDNPEEMTEFKFYIPTVEGENKIKVSAFTTNDEVFAEQEGVCTYNP